MVKFLRLNKNVFWLGLVSLFNDFSNEMIQSIMPVFLSVTLGISPLAIGLIEGTADTITSFLKIFSGWFSDKINKRKALAVSGYILSVLTRPLFIFISTFSQIFAVRVLDRIGKGFRDAPRDALLAESVSDGDLGKSFGYHRAMDAVGGMLGPLAAFLIVPAIAYNYKFLFLIAFAVGILAIFSFSFVSEKKRPDGAELPKFNFRLLKENKNFAIYLGAIFIFGLGTLPVVLMLLQPIGQGLSIGGISVFGSVPLIYFIYSAAFVLGAIPLGKLSDKIGQRPVIAFGFLAAIASYIGLAFASSILSVALLFALFGIYSAATDGVERALAAKLIDQRLLATGQGFLHAAIGISSFLAGLIGGSLWTAFGFQTAFLYGAVVSGIGLIVFVLTGLRKNL